MWLLWLNESNIGSNARTLILYPNEVKQWLKQDLHYELFLEISALFEHIVRDFQMVLAPNLFLCILVTKFIPLHTGNVGENLDSGQI